MELLLASVIVSSLMVLLALIMLLTYLIVRKRISQDGSGPYLCGEDSKDFSSTLSVGSLNFYWGSIASVLRKFYEVIRDKVHTGVLNDWLSFMSIWLSIAVVVLLITVFL